MNEYKIGDKVEIISIGVFNKGFVKVGDIATFVEEHTINCQTWKDTQWISGSLEDLYIKPWVDPEAKTPFEQAGYTKDTVVPKLKFPCCVPTSEIKDEATLKTLTDLFEANGARVVDGVDLDGRVEFERVDCWEYFGVSVRDGGIFRTDFYDNAGSYKHDEDREAKVIIYSVAELLREAKKEIQVVPSVETPWIKWNGSSEAPVDSDTSGYKEPIEPLVSIVKDVKYTVTIKGVDFTFTQDQVNKLVSELEGFVDYE